MSSDEIGHANPSLTDTYTGPLSYPLQWDWCNERNRDKICSHPHQSSRQQENRLRWWSAWFFYTKKMANFISTTVEILFSKAQLDQHTSSSLSWAIIVLVSDSRRHTYDSALQILLCPHNHKYNSVTMHHINPWQTQMNDQPFPSPSSEMLH